MKYVWVREHRCEFPVALMCRVLVVSRSGYYGWLKRGQSSRDRKREKIAAAARRSHVSLLNCFKISVNLETILNVYHSSQYLLFHLAAGFGLKL